MSNLNKEALKLVSKLVTEYGNWDYEVFEELKQMGDDILKQLRPQLIQCLYRVRFIIDEGSCNLKFTLENMLEYVGGKALLQVLNDWVVEEIVEDVDLSLGSLYEIFIPSPYDEDGDYRDFIIYLRDPILEGLKSEDRKFYFITITFIKNLLRLINYLLFMIEGLPYDANNFVLLRFILDSLDWIYYKGAKQYIDGFFNSSCKYSKEELWKMVKDKLNSFRITEQDFR